MQIRAYEPRDKADVVSLWTRAGLTRPWNDPVADIDRKLLVQADWFLVGVLSGELVASVMAGYDGHRGWVNYLAVAPEHQGHGLGRALMEYAMDQLKQAGCPKVNLQVRSDNTDAVLFYESIGFKKDEVISYGRRLIDDE